ncbi:hypothetical protein CLV30_106137 [Haloactinopolyspora alba]|uniref:Uncharacterized protein n=1 Tax=Haloactinopolyspora alba TaxID=648780 RepID=A0A2P8E3T8_9ACTN|nr:DUF5403 family protein [Haloactinopolyspora alba]PSL04132.1 hypothetical protein CLV30_106137 [Haloactinopolyspora alba]
MAEVYRRVKSMELERAIALHRSSQNAIKGHAVSIGNKADAILSRHRHDGHAFIETESGDVDQYVTLNDERGLKAAMSIEFGRKGRENDDGKTVGEMEGLAVLRRAAGIYGEAP